MLPWRARNFRSTSSSNRSTCPPLRPRTRSMTLRILASPPGSKKRVMTRRMSLVKVTGRRRTFREPRRPFRLTDRVTGSLPGASLKMFSVHSNTVLDVPIRRSQRNAKQHLPGGLMRRAPQLGLPAVSSTSVQGRICFCVGHFGCRARAKVTQEVGELGGGQGQAGVGPAVIETNRRRWACPESSRRETPRH